MRTTHGKTNTAIYRVWRGLKSRCLNPHNEHYPYYGGAGITLDPMWRAFEGFYADMGDPPKKGMVLSRKDKAAGFTRDNCEWVPRSQMNRTRKSSHFVTYMGMTKHLKEWADWAGMPKERLSYRLRVLKMPFAEALRPKRLHTGSPACTRQADT